MRAEAVKSMLAYELGLLPKRITTNEDGTVHVIIDGTKVDKDRLEEFKKKIAQMKEVILEVEGD